jgi:uncharacterized protein
MRVDGLIRLVFVLMVLVADVAIGDPAAAQAPVVFGHSSARLVAPDGTEHRFSVEVATTPDQWTQGLMFRRSLPADAGMLFDFGEDRPVSMWMKNTLIPLDMLFIAVDGRVVGIAERAIPLSLAVISAPEPVRGVLELNGGTAARLGIHVGDRLVSPVFGQLSGEAR